MEPSKDNPPAGTKVAESAKEPIKFCPFCGGAVDGGLTLTKEKCPFEDCGKEYYIRSY